MGINFTSTATVAAVPVPVPPGTTKKSRVSQKHKEKGREGLSGRGRRVTGILKVIQNKQSIEKLRYFGFVILKGEAEIRNPRTPTAELG